MKSATLVATLTTVTTGMAVAAPVVVFGFLYVLHVHPARAAALEARARLAVAREELNRQRLFVTQATVGTQVSAIGEFDARTEDGNGVEETVDALTALLDSAAVGGVSNVSVETGAPEDVPTGATVRLFSQTMKQTPLTVTFDARFEQIGRFLRNLRVLPTAFHLQSVEVTPAAPTGPGPTGPRSMRAKLSLLVFHEIRALTPRPAEAARPARNPFASARSAGRSVTPPTSEPDPIVTSILFSSGPRVALVDGRIVRVGDRVRTGTVRSIEPGAVVIVDVTGRERRATIARPAAESARPH